MKRKGNSCSVILDCMLILSFAKSVDKKERAVKEICCFYQRGQTCKVRIQPTDFFHLVTFRAEKKMICIQVVKIFNWKARCF